MRNSIIALLILVGFASCTKTTEPTIDFKTPMYYAGHDSTKVDSCPVFTLKSWKGKTCDGKTIVGKSWRPDGWHTNTTSFTTQGEPVNLDSLKTVTDKKISSGIKDDSNYFGMPDWLKALLGYIFWLAILLFALWLLYKLIQFLLKNSGPGGSTQNSVTNTPVATTTQSTQQEKEQQSGTKRVPTEAEIIALTSLVTATCNNGAGGSVVVEGLSIHINGIQPPLVNIENHGPNANSGDVTIHIGDETITEKK
jgi:hypothetical protein